MKVYPKAVCLIDLLMDVDQRIVAKAQVKYQSPKLVLDSIQKMVQLVGQSLSKQDREDSQIHGGGFVVSKKNIVMAVWDIDSLYSNSDNRTDNSSHNLHQKNKDIFIVGGYRNNSAYAVISTGKNPMLSLKKDGEADESVQSVIRVPRNVIQRHKHSYISSVNYQNSGLFMTTMHLKGILRNIDDSDSDMILKFNITNSSSSSSPLSAGTVRSNVFDVSIGNQSISNLPADESISLQFRNAVPSSLSSPVSRGIDENDNSCRFWKFSTGKILLD